MDSVRVANLKSIKDSGEVSIKPLTILVGKNNSGKSSFLRLFSLLRQSVEVKTRGPLLWYGQYVDFGSFEEAIRKGAEKEGMDLQFSFNIPEFLAKHYGLLHRNLFRRSAVKHLNGLQITISIRLTGIPDMDKPFVDRVKIRFKPVHALDYDECLLEIDHNNRVTRFELNGLDILSFTEDFEAWGVTKIIPFIKPRKIPDSTAKAKRYFWYSGNYQNETDYALYKGLIKVLTPYFRSGTSDSTKLNVIRGMSIEPLSAFLVNLKRIYCKSVTWNNNLNAFSPQSPGFQEIRNVYLATIIPQILLVSDEYIQGVAEKVRSIAPVRATAERYYRKQDLAVNEVDYKGQNLAMYLSNLSDHQSVSFREWTRENFGFEVHVRHERGHVVITIKEEGGDSNFNLADTGFGFSQILPVVAQLWSIASPTAQRSKQESDPYVFTIEQPELHLHPSFQAKVADMFINAVLTANKFNFDLRLLVETHSEAIVNRVGNQIASGYLDKEFVNVVIFDKRSPNESTKVSFARYDDSGYLINWPYGFFQPDEG
jgi:predicted ATPase